MLTSFTFLAPQGLGFLIVLPVLWWLLRLLPPAPRQVTFPALSLLRDLVRPQKAVARTPWWLLLLRLITASLLILAFAGPIIDQQPAASSPNDLFLVIDNDWASARNWDARLETLHALLHQAARDGRRVRILTTAPPADGSALALLGPLAANEALNQIDHLVPLPWRADFAGAKKIVSSASSADLVWIASGVGGPDVQAFADTIGKLGRARIISDLDHPLYTLVPETRDDGTSLISLYRSNTPLSSEARVVLKGPSDETLAEVPVTFSPNTIKAPVSFDALPLDIRNRATRIELMGHPTAASTILLDNSWQKQSVGLVGDKSELDHHSLLSSLYYLDRALKPSADLHVGTLSELLNGSMAVIILKDSHVNERDAAQLLSWVKKGGVLIRFADEGIIHEQYSPSLESLIPVPLRTSDRALGGTLSWATPQKLQAFSNESPFHNLSIPDDVTVSRQILAEPTADTSAHTWASLADNTPLVTAKHVGSGLSVLFHVPAYAGWSNLPLSGLFVDMLKRLVGLAHSSANSSYKGKALPLWRRLDAFGQLQKSEVTLRAYEGAELTQALPGPQTPPGLYGTDASFHAFNLGPALGLPDMISDVPVDGLNLVHHEIDCMPYFLCAAFVFYIFDFMVSLYLRGFLIPLRGAVLFLVLLMLAPSAIAASPQQSAVELTGKTWLGYIRTGHEETDRISEAGLRGLAQVLLRRTSISPIDITGVDPNNDDLTFFPILYWPLEPGEAPLSNQGAARVNNFLSHGGIILFDTRTGEPGVSASLKATLMGINLPPLIALPQEHVLRHSFYLLDEFPGRYAGHALWLESTDPSSNDGVSSIILGENDYAAAWAADASGHFMFACIPDGERQREQAFRFGVNVVMYALTGNYKSDQLHMETLMKRMEK